MAEEPLFGIHAVPVDWPVLRQDLRIVEVHMVFSRGECHSDTFRIECSSTKAFTRALRQGKGIPKVGSLQ